MVDAGVSWYLQLVSFGIVARCFNSRLWVPFCVLCDRVLQPLCSIPARMKISLDVIWLKDAFRESTDPVRIPHGLTK